MRIGTDKRPEPARKQTGWVRGIHGSYERHCGIFDLRVTDYHPHFRAELWHHLCGLHTPYALSRYSFDSVKEAQRALEIHVAGLCYAAIEDLGDDISDAHRQGLSALLEKPKKKRRS